jgi:hypothetical protein
MRDSVRVVHSKIGRAADHIHVIRKEIDRYASTQPNRIFLQPDGKETLGFADRPPVEIAMLAGEAVYQLRSALDYLIFDLVQLNYRGIKLPRGWEERCQYPIRTKLPKGCIAPPCDRIFFENDIPGLNNTAFAFIERTQPYYGRNPGNTLGTLVALSNIDKHRHLNLTNPQAFKCEEVVTPRSRNVSIVRMTEGAELEPLSGGSVTPDVVDVKRLFVPFVSFDESALCKGEATLPVYQVLEECLEVVRILVAPLEQLLNAP